MLSWHLMEDCFSQKEMRDIWSETVTISTWLKFEQVLAQVQAEIGLIPENVVEALGKFSVNDIDAKQMHEDMLLIGRPILGLVKQLRMHVGPELAPYVHFNSTTQDVMDTTLALQMSAGVDLVTQSIERLISHLDAHASLHTETKTIGRTNGQHALPMKLSIKFELWRAELIRRKNTLLYAAEKGLLVQVGGPLGDLSKYEDGNGVRIKEEMAKKLGLGIVQPHWQNTRDVVADIVTALGTLCASLCKIAHNVHLLSSTDIGELSESHQEGKGISSSMGHKRNQRASEFAEATGRLGRQRAEQIGELGLHEHERFGGVWIGEWVVVPEVFLMTSGSLSWSEKMLNDLVINAEQMEVTARAKQILSDEI